MSDEISVRVYEEKDDVRLSLSLWPAAKLPTLGKKGSNESHPKDRE